MRIELNYGKLTLSAFSAQHKNIIAIWNLVRLKIENLFPQCINIQKTFACCVKHVGTKIKFYKQLYYMHDVMFSEIQIQNDSDFLQKKFLINTLKYKKTVIFAFQGHLRSLIQHCRYFLFV